jgi:uncharacterized protein DUF4406
MITSATEFGLKLMKAVGAQVGVTYLSSPISTGYRDLHLMRELGVQKEELRERYPKEYRERVTGPNERESHKYAQMVRQLRGGRLVINPGELFVPEWTQTEYLAFWEETIRNYCLEMALAPAWEFSAGARFEATLALSTNLRISDVRGRELMPADLQAMDERARLRLAREGFARELVDRYVPWIDFVGVSADPIHLTDNVRAFSDIAVRHGQAVQDRQARDD